MMKRNFSFSLALLVGLTLVPRVAALASESLEGKELFEPCSKCHSLDPDVRKVGPSLFGLFGREAGTQEGYRYSSALLNSDIVWNEDTLDAFLTNPRTFFPGTRMSYRGIEDDQDRHELIEWLRDATSGSDMAMTGDDMMSGMMGNEGEMAEMMEGIDMMPGSTRLMMPAMDSQRGRVLFVTKGCVACHAINGIGGEDAPPLDADLMPPVMNPFDFAAKMWRVAPLMIGAQEDEIGGQILFSGEELADIIAFVHDADAQQDFSEADLTDEAREMLEHHHDEMGEMDGHDEETGHMDDEEHEEE